MWKSSRNLIEISRVVAEKSIPMCAEEWFYRKAVFLPESPLDAHGEFSFQKIITADLVTRILFFFVPKYSLFYGDWIKNKTKNQVCRHFFGLLPLRWIASVEYLKIPVILGFSGV